MTSRKLFWDFSGDRMLEPAPMLEANEESVVVAHVAPDRPRLLVIDDDYLHRKIICRVAAKAGYAPAGAATYEEAIKLALENAFDCISLDLSLGQHGGTGDAAISPRHRLQGAPRHHQRLRRSDLP